VAILPATAATLATKEQKRIIYKEITYIVYKKKNYYYFVFFFTLLSKFSMRVITPNDSKPKTSSRGLPRGGAMPKYPSGHQLIAQARKKFMSPHINDTKPLTPEERRLQQPPIQRQPWLSYNPPTHKKYPTALQLKAQARKKLMSPHIHDPSTPAVIRHRMKMEAYSEMSTYIKKLDGYRVGGI
jgi:hypothetical protein